MGKTNKAEAMHVAGTSQIPPLDAARLLQEVLVGLARVYPPPHVRPLMRKSVVSQALADLDLVKRQITQPFMAKASVEAKLSRLEEDLRAKTKVMG